jgi:hypothetical protein
MMKRMVLILAAAVLWSGVSFASATPEEKENSEFINSLFVSACGHAPDPASLSYFQGLFEDRVESADRLRETIQKTCRPDPKEACQHVRGLSDLCGVSAS